MEGKKPRCACFPFKNGGGGGESKPPPPPASRSEQLSLMNRGVTVIFVILVNIVVPVNLVMLRYLAILVI